MRPHHVKDILITSEKIAERINSLVKELAPECHHEHFVMIGILRGSFVFLADLVRDLYEHEIHPQIDFLTLASYGVGTESSGTVSVLKDISVAVAGAHVLLVDDILDTGRTLGHACRHLKEKGAQTVHTCTLLDKPSRRVVPVEADFVGFIIEDHFVVGYGLDYDSYYRELPYISKLTFLD